MNLFDSTSFAREFLFDIPVGMITMVVIFKNKDRNKSRDLIMTVQNQISEFKPEKRVLIETSIPGIMNLDRMINKYNHKFRFLKLMDKCYT